MSEVTPPTPSSPSNAPVKPKGIGAAIGSGLAAFTGGLVSISGKLFGEVRERGGTALADFRARPEHSRWRVYTLGSYGLIVAATLVAQFYSENPLHANVRTSVDDLGQTEIFVVNNSSHDWNDVRLTLNGMYGFAKLRIGPGDNILLPVNRFAVNGPDGKPRFAQRTMAPRTLTIEAAEGRYEMEFGK
ncbi:MAG TPA: hypothetical protein VLW85_11075 [Myxococcales bacterium]|nr:hypothetical protein [Myxococcales bacterium]